MYTVVVADDEQEMREALIRRVDWEAAGFQVIGAAENGADALELVERLEPDLLLADVKMPFMTGIELARAVREIRPTMQIAFLSGYDDFSYAQQAIQYNIVSYILKPVSSEKMLGELQKIRQKMDRKFEEFYEWTSREEKCKKEAFVMSLLMDPFPLEMNGKQNEALQNAAAECGLFNSKNAEIVYVVVMIRITDEKGENKTRPGSANAIDSILKKYIHYFSFYTNGRVVSLLSATKAGMNKYLHILVSDISQSVERISGLQVFIGVSREVQELSGCHEAYMDAMNALGYSRKNESRVCFISDLERTEAFDHEEIYGAISVIENLVRCGTQRDLKDYMQELLCQIKENKIGPEAARFMMVQCVAAVFRVVYTAVDRTAFQELQSISPLQYQTIHEDPIIQWDKYITFCTTAKRMLSEQQSKSGSAICDQAMDIIRLQYSDPDLSLVSISNAISVTPNYLSTLMKKSTGHTFIELLTGKRIEVAKELMLNSSMKIREIAQSCGYRDQHYFSYSFKKSTGLSPNACRRKNEEERQEF